MTLEARGGTVWRDGKRTKYNMESDPAAMREEAMKILEAANFVEKMQSNAQAVAEYKDYMRNMVMPYAYKQYSEWRSTPAFTFEVFKEKYPSSGTVRDEVNKARFRLEGQAVVPDTKE